MATLLQNQYGKSRVRFLKVLRRDATYHDVRELEADVRLRGELAESYLSDENRSIVPTDTVKNTLHFLAHDRLEECRSEFALAIGRHFLEKYGHLTGVTVELRERVWKRLPISGLPHPHAFEHDANGTPFTLATFERGGKETLKSGLRGHLILKSTASGFVGYHVCELTTLAPVTDRIFATRLTAEWEFSDLAANFREADAAVLAAAHRIFAGTYSPSVQRTLYQIGEEALQEVPSISRIRLAMPNVHFLPLDLSRLGRPDQNVVFLPTDEPHGQIEATLARH